MNEERESGSVENNGDQKVPQKTIKRVLESVYVSGLISLSGLGLYGLASMAVETAQKLWPQTPVRPEAPIFPLDGQGRRLTRYDYDFQGILKKSIESYELWAQYGQYNLQPLLNTVQPKETAALLEKLGKDFVTEGVSTLQTAWLLRYSEDLAIVDSSKENLWINGDHYNLQDRYEVQLAGAWIQTKIMQIDKQIQIALTPQGRDLGELPLQVEELQQNLEDLTWLRHRDAPIDFSEEAFAFFPRSEMVIIARVFQSADSLNLNLPRYVEWCHAGCLNDISGKNVIVKEDGTIEVRREGRPGGIPTSIEGVKLVNTNLAESLVHEIGHLVHDKNNYLQRFIGIRGHRGTASNINEQLKYVSLYAMADEMEDFAETFTLYTMRGDYFRALLEELRIHAPDTWQVMQAKYDLMTEVWRGLEFSTSAQVRNLGREKQQQEFSGVKWSPANRVLTVSPNPNAWPGKRTSSMYLPILNGEKIDSVSFFMEIDPFGHTYKLSIPNSSLVYEVTLNPLAGDSLVFLPQEKNSNVPANLLSLGIGESMVLPMNLFDDRIGLQFTIESFPAVQSGQHRVIRDNFPSLIALQEQAGSDSSVDWVYAGGNVLIVGGPQEAYYGYSGQVEKFWLVRRWFPLEGYTRPGWVSGRWIGQTSTP